MRTILSLMLACLVFTGCKDEVPKPQSYRSVFNLWCRTDGAACADLFEATLSHGWGDWFLDNRDVMFYGKDPRTADKVNILCGGKATLEGTEESGTIVFMGISALTENAFCSSLAGSWKYSRVGSIDAGVMKLCRAEDCTYWK